MASVMRPVLAYLATVSMDPLSMERVVRSASDSRAEVKRGVEERNEVVCCMLLLWVEKAVE